MSTENSNLAEFLNTNDCFGSQGLEANEIGADCYCRFM